MTTQESKTFTVSVKDGPGSERIIYSLQGLLLGIRPSAVVSFRFQGIEEPIELVITGVSAVECIDGTNLAMTAALPRDLHWFFPLCQDIRRMREFVFSNYNHHSRKGFVQIPTGYLSKLYPPEV